MIVIKSVKIFGETNEGKFSSTIKFRKGVNIYSGDNGLGKTLISKSILWGLGLEQAEVLKADDDSFLPESIREKFKLEDGSFAKIKRSYVKLLIQTDSNEKLYLTRPVTGGNKEKIKCKFGDNEFVLTSNSARNFSDPQTNLTRFVMERAGIKPVKVLTREGRMSWLYAENITSLIYVNQLLGWNDLFYSQPRFYGILEANECSIEFLLGLNANLEKRQRVLGGAIASRDHRSLIVKVIEDINKFVTSYSKDLYVPYKGKSIDDLKDYFSKFNLLQYLENKGRFDLKRELKEKQERLDSHYERLDEESLNQEKIKGDKNAKKLMLRLLSFKSDLKETQEDLQDIAFRIASKKNALEAKEQKLLSTKHLKDFKESSIGFFSNDLSCPTCTQVVSTETFNFKELNSEDIVRTIEGYKKEISMLKKAIESEHVLYLNSSKEEKEIQRNIENIQNEIRPYLKSVSYSKEKIIELADQVVNLKHQVEKANDKLLEAVDLNKRLKDVIFDTSAAEDQKDIQEELKKEEKVKQFFIKTYQNILEEIQITLFQGKSETAKEVYFDESYLPIFRGQYLRNFASASDQSRIILPYLLSCLKTSIENGGNHLGFIILDEPLQQNPDSESRKRMVNFFSRLSKLIKGQAIIFTNLTDSEIARISKSSPNTIKKVNEKRFLKIGTVVIGDS